MMIIGCDFHPSWQQVSWLDTETGETGEQKRAGLGRRGTVLPASSGAGADRHGSHRQLSLAGGFAEQVGSRVVGGRCGPDSCQLRTTAEDGQARCGAPSEAAGRGTVSADLDAVE